MTALKMFFSEQLSFPHMKRGRVYERECYA